MKVSYRSDGIGRVSVAVSDTTKPGMILRGTLSAENFHVRKIGLILITFKKKDFMEKAHLQTLNEILKQAELIGDGLYKLK